MALQNNGLEFFYLSVNFFDNDKIVLIESEYGSRATLLAVRLLCKIYGLNYYYRWGKDECLLFAHKLGSDYTPEYVQQVVDALVNRHFFDKTLYEQQGILTSETLQQHYFEAAHRRKQVVVTPDYLLVDVKKYKNVVTEGGQPLTAACNEKEENVDTTAENADTAAQRKRKETKAEERREEERKTPPSVPPQGEVRMEDILASIPKDGVKRNCDGLIEELQRLGLKLDEQARLVKYCNYGMIGHPVWQALASIRDSRGKIQQPVKYLWAWVRRN